MPVFDRDSGKLVVRVVYDGPGSAGKTTNLTQICALFSPARRSELVSPEERDGRTMWFDWLQLDGGLVGGYGLRCQIISVPGQLVLRRRRIALLSAADVVVMVCDSTPDGVDRLSPAFGRVRQFVAEHAGADVPLVIQANKQDLPDALRGDELAQCLGADASIPVVAACARDATGVRETLVLAIRAAAGRAQQLVLEKGIDALAGKADDADSVLAELRRLDPGSSIRFDHVLDEGWDAHESATPAASTRAPTVVPEHAQASTELAAPPAWWPAPPTNAQIAARGIWPVSVSARLPIDWVRDTLRSADAWEHRACPDPEDGSRKATTVLFEASGWCLKTSQQRCFADVDQARAAMVSLARAKLWLGSMAPRDTFFVVASPAPDAHWVWTYTPWTKTLRAEINSALLAGDADALGGLLARYGAIVIEACLRAVRLGQALDLHPSNFAVYGDRVGYLDDDVLAASRLPGAADALLQRAEELDRHPVAIARYGDAIIAAMRERLDEAHAESSGLLPGLRDATPRSALARELRARLLAAYSNEATAADATAPSAPAAETSAVVAATIDGDATAKFATPGAGSTDWPAPPAAPDALPSGFIWPVAGRELMRKLAQHPARKLHRDGFTYELGDYTVTTAEARRFADVDEGRAELQRLARSLIEHGAAPEVVLVLAPAASGDVHWLWTYAPMESRSEAERREEPSPP